MKNSRLVFFRFTELGHPHWVAIEHWEMESLYECALELLELYTDPEELHDLVINTTFDLRIQARTRLIDEDWISTAVMLNAVRGLMGQRLSEWSFDPV